MQQIIKYFWQMCLLRASPDRLPGSLFALGLVLAIYVVIALFEWSITRSNLTMAVISAMLVLGLVIHGLMTFVLLLFKNHRNRFNQTFAALLGTDALVQIIQLPFALSLFYGWLNNALSALAESLFWICFGWWLAIAGTIYHHAVNISILQGSAYAFLTRLLVIMTLFTLFEPG